jgi:hypothetical protein
MAVVAIPTTFLLIWPLTSVTDVSVIVQFLVALIGSRNRDRLCAAADRRPLERGTTAAWHDERSSSRERHAARRLGCGLQRNHRRHLADGVARVPIPALRSIGSPGF